MRKFQFLLAGLFILGYLIIPVVFSQSSKELSADEFKQKVAELNAMTQSKLEAALKKLLGSNQSGSPPIGEEPAPSSQMAPAPSDTETPENNLVAPPAPTTGSGLNMYQQ